MASIVRLAVFNTLLCEHSFPGTVPEVVVINMPAFFGRKDQRFRIAGLRLAAFKHFLNPCMKF
jgi:hypothetical protein